MGLTKKHGVTLVGGWVAPSEHLWFIVYKAPTFEAFQKIRMDPVVAQLSAYDSTEIKLAFGLED